jgi:hypothetical protein
MLCPDPGASIKFPRKIAIAEDDNEKEAQMNPLKNTLTRNP